MSDGGCVAGELPNMRKIEPVTLEYKRINLQVPGKKDGKPVTRVVLDDVRGCVAAGTFTAIMGPSGGGKTSLLNVLAGRVARQKGLTLTGELLIKGKPRDESTFKAQAAYVMQVGGWVGPGTEPELPGACPPRRRRTPDVAVCA